MFGAMVGTIFNAASLAARLDDLGWLAADVTKTSDALAKYQSHFGLPVCGELDGATERHLCACRACRFPDVMAMAEELQAWPKGMVVTWCIATASGALNRTAAETAYMASTKAWSDVCGIKFEPTTNPKTARLTVHFDGIDGAGRCLAWSELPDPSGAPRIQRFDAEENWVISDKPKQGEIDAIRVITHEIGHAIGIGHLSAGNLLQPMYDPGIRSPRQGDIVEAVARYGPPTVPVNPPSGVLVNGTRKKQVVIDIDGETVSVSTSGFASVK